MGALVVPSLLGRLGLGGKLTGAGAGVEKAFRALGLNGGPRAVGRLGPLCLDPSPAGAGEDVFCALGLTGGR